MSEPDPRQDIRPLLDDWPHEPGSINARIVDGDDGRPCVQVRVELGVLQMEMTGRPDGQRPDGRESMLEALRHRRQWYVDQTGSEVGFLLSPDDCRALREETVQYYHRYVALFALGEFAAVVADAAHNLEIVDFCHQYAAEDDDKRMLEQLRPGIIAMRTRAEAELAVASKQPKDALAAIDRALDEIKAVYERNGATDQWEQCNEVQLLRGMRDMLVPKLPGSQRVELQERLQAAVEAENYELAAILRNEIRMLGY